MDYEQIYTALEALGDVELKMRQPGDWYACVKRVEIGDGRVLVGEFGNGRTPQAALESYWRILTTLAPQQTIVVNAYSDRRREYRWAGFMWQEQPARHPGQ